MPEVPAHVRVVPAAGYEDRGQGAGDVPVPGLREEVSGDGVMATKRTVIGGYHIDVEFDSGNINKPEEVIKEALRKVLWALGNSIEIDSEWHMPNRIEIEWLEENRSYRILVRLLRDVSQEEKTPMVLKG